MIEPNECAECGADMICEGPYLPAGAEGCPPRAERTLWRCPRCGHQSETLPRRGKHD